MAAIDFNDHDEVIAALTEAQDAEQDMRQQARDAKLFLTKRDGMWDPYAITKMDGRFRGTFDLCTPIVDQISGEIEQSDFTLNVSPSGGEASEDTAKTLNGLIRNIRNISNAENVFQSAGRSNVVAGFDAWEIVQDWVDGDTFDQDLFIRRIPNAVDSVWFDLSSVMQDRSDAKWGVKLQAIPRAEYEDRWPDSSGLSVGDDKRSEAFTNKAETITVGQLYFKKPEKIEIIRMDNGAVYKIDDDFDKVKDDLAQQGIAPEADDEGEEKRRTRDSWRVHSRMFDGNDFLADDQETVFDFIPIIPIYGNYDIVDNKTVYFGKLENLFDQQRVLNYAMSRDIEDGALSPATYIQMTPEQLEGHGDEYEDMNVDRKPVRTYEHQDNVIPPMQVGGVQVSQGLQATIALTKDMISGSANIFLAQQGNALGAQSGVAGKQNIDQGNIGAIKWFKALEIAICHTGKVLINAIPRVYDSTRQVRILEEDGSGRMVTLNQKTFDQQTQTNVELNDLTIGEYDVVCDVGPAFNSQQKETAQAFLDMAAIDPSIAQKGMDIWLKNLSVPGMDLMAERARQELLQAGIIPQDQWTEEEAQQIQQAQEQAAQQEQQPDPLMVAAQAEMQKAQADQQNAANKQQEIQGNQQIATAQIQLKDKELDLDIAKFNREKDDKFNVEAAKIDQGQQKIDIQAEDQRFNQIMQAQKRADEQQAALLAAFQSQAQTLKTLREAMGVDAIVGPHNQQAYINQAVDITDSQEEAGIDTAIGEDVTGS